MGLTNLLAKVFFKKAVEAAPEKIEQAAHKIKAWKAGERAPAPVTTLDKILRFRPVIWIVLILAFAGSLIMSNQAGKYRPVWGTVRDTVICEYGDPQMENADYVRMDVVSAEALGYFYKTYKSKTSSTTDLYDIYLVKDAAGRSALYCDSTHYSVVMLTTTSNYQFLNNSFPCAIAGFVTNIKKQFGTVNDYKKLVTAEMEEMDLIMEATPTQEKEGYIQSEEDKQKEQQWRALATVCEYILVACVLSLIILSILRKRQIRKAEQAELESEQQKELYR